MSRRRPQELTGCALSIRIPRYNKQESDFASLDEYNDYLEMVEDIGGLGMRVNKGATYQ
jgi:hypothetical protein